MRKQRAILFFVCTLSLFLSLQLAACGGPAYPVSQAATGNSQTGATPGQASSGVDHAVPLVILHDPAPGALEVVFNIDIAGYGADRGNTMIGLSFLSHGSVVQLAGHEQLLCNGKAMPVHQQYALFQLADAPSQSLAGKLMSCTYRVNTHTTTFSFVVPGTPVILSPHEGASVPRSTHTVVSYNYDARSGKLDGVVALGVLAKTVSKQLNTPGPMQTSLDTSAFPSGKGSLVLTEELTPRASWTGEAFRSLSAEGTASASVAVTWI